MAVAEEGGNVDNVAESTERQGELDTDGVDD